MRHRKSGVKLNRTTSHRQAMFRNMVTSLLKHDRIKTTDAKAKELRRWADHIVTLAKRGDLHARRMALSIVREKDVVHKIFEEASERFGSINGGYTRIVKIGRRPGDAAAMTLVELVSSDVSKTTKAKKKKIKAESKPTVAETRSTQTEPAVSGTAETVADDRREETADVNTAAVDTESEATGADDATQKDPKASADSGVTDK
ncbi:MAG: 50S ribosomal protein L17 [Deltaproteobacteria bacterium]|nr:50S ribosomal protein L17 [Deltaproteobacteria bacterium]